MLPRPPQPGFDQRFLPDRAGDYPGPDGPGGYPGPGGPGRPGEPGRPAGPSRGRRRITGAFSRLGSLTPGAGFAAARRSREPARSDQDRDQARDQARDQDWGQDRDQDRDQDWGQGWDQDAGYREGQNADPWDDEGAVDARRPARGNAAMPPGENPNRNRNRALVAGACALSVVAIAGVFVAPKMLGKSDPGCTAYAGPALTAYDRTINDLNTQATQSHVAADMSTAITELTQAAAQAQGSAVKSALNGLITELKTVQGDVAAGAVPASAVNALNAASTTADHAC